MASYSSAGERRKDNDDNAAQGRDPSQSETPLGTSSSSEYHGTCPWEDLGDRTSTSMTHFGFPC